MSYQVAFVSLGCAKNLVNTEQMMALCRKAGHIVTGEPEGADVAVLTVPGSVAQATADKLIECGIRGIWNFTSVRLSVPDGVIVQNVDLAQSLAVLSHAISAKR